MVGGHGDGSSSQDVASEAFPMMQVQDAKVELKEDSEMKHVEGGKWRVHSNEVRMQDGLNLAKHSTEQKESSNSSGSGVLRKWQ